MVFSNTLLKVVKWTVYTILGVICAVLVVLCSYHAIFYTPEHADEIAELPAWMQSFPRWLLDVIVDIKRFFS